MVRVEGALVQEHGAPWWVLLTRVGLVVGATLLLPLQGVVLAPVLVALWIVSAFVVRYPVTLAPGRALFLGGYRNTDRPGRYWVRRRRAERAFSISRSTRRIDWRPAPTRLMGAGDAWLELTLELWVEPRPDEAGQFTALLQYQLWHEHHSAVATRLRKDVLDLIVDHLGEAGVLARMQGRPLVLGDEVLPALDEGLEQLGLRRVALGRRESRLVPRTEDLSSEDWVCVDEQPPPAAES